jgi:hypothetical protein
VILLDSAKELDSSTKESGSEIGLVGKYSLSLRAISDNVSSLAGGFQLISNK